MAIVDSLTAEFAFASVGLFLGRVIGPHVEAKEYGIPHDTARALRALNLQLHYPSLIFSLPDTSLLRISLSDCPFQRACELSADADAHAGEGAIKSNRLLFTNVIAGVHCIEKGVRTISEADFGVQISQRKTGVNPAKIQELRDDCVCGLRDFPNAAAKYDSWTRR